MVKKWRSITFILPLTLIGVGFFVNSASAEDAVFRAVVDEYLSLELDSTHMEVNVLPSEPFASGYVTATVNTNAAAGYTLTFQDTDSRNGLEREGYDEATDKSPFNIPSVSADTTYASLAADSWGYYLGSTTDTEATYKQIPLSATEIKTTDTPAADDASRVSFGVKIADTRPSGLYEDELTFTLVSNIIEPSTTTFDEAYAAANKTKDATSGKYKMQDMTPSICSAVTDEQTTTLIDTRDGTVYNVVKALDHRCWLADNLALDPVTNGSSLTPQNTNATQEAINNYLTSSGVAPHSGWATVAVGYAGDSIPTQLPRINTQSASIAPQNPDDPLMNLAEDWRVGVYYNLCAASVGTYCYTSNSNAVDKDPNSAIDIDQDVCPVGWRLPTGGEIGTIGTTTEGGGEYQTLVDAYQSNGEDNTQYIRVRESLRLPLSGRYYEGEANDLGNNSYFWSSTYYGTRYTYGFSVNRTSLYPQNLGYRNGGSVRCIAKEAQP